MPLAFLVIFTSFVAGQALGMTGAVSRDFMNRVALIQELKARFVPAVPLPVTSTSVPLTPTQIHEQILSTYGIAQDTLADAKERYKDIYTQAVARERQLAQSYYVFYHAQKSEVRIVHDLLKELYALLHITKPLYEFEFLRIWYEASDALDLNEFIDKEEDGKEAPGWNDHQISLSRLLLSVNLSLFGNMGDSGESSYFYFANNTSVNPPPVQSLLAAIFDTFGFNKSYIHRLVDLHQALITPEGTLFQIFVPKKQVDKYVYLSHSYGTPYRDVVDYGSYSWDKRRHLKISTLLELYTTDPEKFGDIDQLQARMLLTKDGVLNPHSEVKIFRYTMIPQDALNLYKKQLQLLIREIVADALSKSDATAALYETHLGRLVQLHKNALV